MLFTIPCTECKLLTALFLPGSSSHDLCNENLYEIVIVMRSRNKTEAKIIKLLGRGSILSHSLIDQQYQLFYSNHPSSQNSAFFIICSDGDDPGCFSGNYYFLTLLLYLCYILIRNAHLRNFLVYC